MSTSTVTRQVVDILRATIYSIIDPKCFASPPSNEDQVHSRIEAILRSVFPNLRHKPTVAKPIKNFEPDTGLPSVETLIEYKFISTQADVKRVADEVLADTRGYVSKDWSQFVYVIYETKRLRSQVEWKELLRSSGVDESAQILVICGEEPRSTRSLIVEAKKPGRRRKRQ